jgi:hypothetical protein
VVGVVDYHKKKKKHRRACHENYRAPWRLFFSASAGPDPCSKLWWLRQKGGDESHSVGLFHQPALY